MIAIEWTIPAFAQLEAMPQKIVSDVIKRVDLLESFPEMGVSLHSQYAELHNCRQLIIKRSYRVLYEYDQPEARVLILTIQHCRQQLPSPTELKLARLLLPPEG